MIPLAWSTGPLRSVKTGEPVKWTCDCVSCKAHDYRVWEHASREGYYRDVVEVDVPYAFWLGKEGHSNPLDGVRLWDTGG